MTRAAGLGAAHWVDRWERQQERYAIDREARFTAMVDVIEHATRSIPRPLVVDLGCGPGSLASRVVDRLPQAEVVAVDADPFLLELGRAGRPQVARYVQATIGADGWLQAVALDRRPDVVVSATALHYLPAAELIDLYRVRRGPRRPAADRGLPGRITRVALGTERGPGRRPLTERR